ncbi:MAG: hypothetical protein WAL64_04245 [Candidatus Dormiibacterota bacterium]|jgi:hypothetical protein
MRRIIIRGLVLAAGLGVAAAAGAPAVAAATPSATSSASGSASSTPTPSASSIVNSPAIRKYPRFRAIGEVVSDTSSGGSLGAGQLVLKEPDGTDLTITLAHRTKGWRYHGLGVKPTSENPGAIADGEIVVAVGRSLFDLHVALRVLDLGFAAS